MICNDCPRKCNLDRAINKGFCNTGDLFKVARSALHFFEEPCISGNNGSGTIFFSGCNLRCVYCQNFEISHFSRGKEVSEEKLISLIFNLAEQGANNINFVTPSHFAVKLSKVLEKVKPSLNIPLLYNSSGYDDIDTLVRLDGLIDIYLPDLKYYDNNVSKKFSNVNNYFDIASLAVLEMKRQQPTNVIENGLMKKGLIIRHLILPTLTDQSKKIINFVASELGTDTYMSIMSQYFPTANSANFKEINRRITQNEYDRVIDYFFKQGMSNGYMQQLTSAIEEYVPSFDLDKI